MDSALTTIARRSDGDLSRALEGLLRATPDVQVTYDWISPGATARRFSDLGSDSVWMSLVKANAASIQRLNFVLPGYHVTYGRGGMQGQNWPTMDQLQVQVHNDGTAEALRVDSLLRLNEQFPPISLKSVNTPATEEDSLRALEQSRLQRLTELTEKFFEQGLEFKTKIEQEQADKEKRLEERLASERDQINNELAAGKMVLDEREEDLEKRRQALDDKDNTHARRGIRERMLQDIKERVDDFGVSRSTAGKRNPVRAGIWLLLSFLSISFCLAIFQLEQRPVGDQGQDHWINWARLAISGAGFVAALLYYIKWEDSWARKHADIEFNLRQFQIDLNRASWVVETTLEWKKEGEGKIPEELLKAISKGLFDSSQSQADPVLHPADELASALLGTASKLKLKTSAGELEFDKPGKIPNEPRKP